MIKFKDEKLKSELLEALQYIDNKCQISYIYSEELGIDDSSITNIIELINFIKCVNQDYTKEELEEYEWDDVDDKLIIIDENCNIDISVIDDDDVSVSATISEIIEVTQKAENVYFDENGVCYSDNKIIFRVGLSQLALENYDYISSLEFYKEFKYKAMLAIFVIDMT